ncbi:MAG TPA: potassium channel family protein [Pseudogracilibacillus sp.]|nr:potassium channel family protein [Pseudogracilibacillus sp.]
MSLLFIVIICMLMLKSIRHFLLLKELKTVRHEKTISVEVFYTFVIMYCIFIIGFGLIYFLLSLNQSILIENVLRYEGEVDYLRKLFHSIYFSGVTLLTIGYGDVTPIGIGRIIAIVQALFGYVLPTSFVLKLVQLNKSTHKKP